MASLKEVGEQNRRLLAIVSPPQRLRPILQRLLDETEFLSLYGVRSLSKSHAQQPYRLDVNGYSNAIAYEPAESTSGMFGGNSNWRGPIWFPMNFLLIESLLKFHAYLGDDFRVECPTGSGQWMTLAEVAAELSQRLTCIFLRNEAGNRPVHGGNELFQKNPGWQNLLLFYEYFHGDNGAGLGANHQTGWTGLVATLIHHDGEAGKTASTHNSELIVSALN